MRYKLYIPARFEKALRRVPNKIAKVLRSKILGLRDDPRPPDAKKIKGRKSWYRIRAGQYRIVYEVKDKELLVLIIHASDRGSVYEDLKHIK